MNRRIILALALAASAFLTACGGCDSGNAGPSLPDLFQAQEALLKKYQAAPAAFDQIDIQDWNQNVTQINLLNPDEVSYCGAPGTGGKDQYATCDSHWHVLTSYWNWGVY